MTPRVYVETSIVSYLTARPSKTLVVAARQQITRDWWESQRGEFSLFVSEFVLEEAAEGDPFAAAARLDALAGIPELALSEPGRVLANALVTEGPLPPKAALDALHIATAVTNGIDYLLTWNFKHLANATVRSRIENACRARGYEPPIICTPDALFNDSL